MELNNIQLPAYVVASLYQSVLVETTKENDRSPDSYREADTQRIAEDNEWKFLGYNQKNILVVVDYTSIGSLPDNDLEFLNGVLGACKLSVGDVAIINFNNYRGKSNKEILKHFSSRTVLFFGISPETFGLPLVFPQFQVQEHAGISFLYAPPITELGNDKVLKSKLWVCLRRLFNV